MYIKSKYRWADEYVQDSIMDVAIRDDNTITLRDRQEGMNGNRKYFSATLTLSEQRRLRDRINENLGSIAGVELKTVAV